MEESNEAAPSEEADAKPEHPEKADIELDLAELDKVSGGTTAAASRTVGVYQIVPIAPDAETDPVGGVFQIEAI
jgi:hypothetical protein